MKKINFEKKTQLREQILLTFQVAILGMVTPNLRGITVGFDSEKIRSVFIYDGPVTDIEEEVLSDIEAEIIASFPNHTIELEVKRNDHPASISEEYLDAWVYRRLEK